ncbi:ABC transporter ATP-binding protein [Cupriavidus metallidurans]|uniref:ABC transporter ATP-binding protein n=1 Tax=Cupriavidus metallidurans TaxID=119219 RepID=UPI001BFC1D3F|nr:ABC transporter ATP-binding protein [Cupriavidus metallidurans]QWC92309.1 ABC transporter ATP-binding protein [Cupriavidus metallidurans]
MDLLEVHHLSKSFGDRPVLDDIGFNVGSGQFFTLVGPSGCGKTTLLRLLGGFSEPDSGEVLFDGKSLQGVPPEHRPMHTVFQSYALFPHMTVAANIAFPLRMQKLRRHDIDGRLGSLIENVRLQGFERYYPHELSGGQRQRVAIARALAARPRLLLLDEPLSALDAALQTQMLHELIALQQQLGVAFIYVTHDQTHALALSQRIAVMHEGHIVQLDTPEAIYRAPATTFVAGFIGSCNLLDATVAESSAARLRVRIAGVGERDMPAGQALAIGSRGTVAIRPEEIQLRPRGASPGGNASTPMLEGAVVDRLYQGDVTLYTVELASGHRLQTMVANAGPVTDGQFTRGDRVELDWPGNAGVFLSR